MEVSYLSAPKYFKEIAKNYSLTDVPELVKTEIDQLDKEIDQKVYEL